ncbi:hypothetical protein M4R22_00425 [Acidovorax sp. GBBC 3334]|uniref:hypothetical protein n=1 Tax=Acidovorax sp. GBBC 3334 TaxID=2940496 RepID=UPI00230412E7|nr:hypothetical protein [Acidovorax sp. GBBC 3334]MDA8453216.1 hypothetical protein [Acidovorax sp. GBBC 3334]
MKLSPFFHDLRSAYQSELDDLALDSEGKDVLRKRLAQKRGEIAFLAQMIDFSPEMVAVAFHQGFRFHRPAALDPLLMRSADELPEWPALGGSVALEPWAQALADVVLAEPSGARFLTVAAVLEYARQHARYGAAAAQESEDAEDGEGSAERHDDDDSARWSADDADEPRTPADRDEAAADWLADLGFDRKD